MRHSVRNALKVMMKALVIEMRAERFSVPCYRSHTARLRDFP